MKKLSLCVGCGFDKQISDELHDWINLDSNPMCRPDRLRDIRKGMPFSDNTFDLIYCSHVLEHFGGEDFVFIMNELHRILKPYGELTIVSPYYKHFGAWTDPHHKMFFNEHTFEHYWFPNVTGLNMGINGWFYPIVNEVAEEQELRVIMQKVSGDVLMDYINKLGIKKGIDNWDTPDFTPMFKDKKYYDLIMVKK